MRVCQSVRVCVCVCLRICFIYFDIKPVWLFRYIYFNNQIIGEKNKQILCSVKKMCPININLQRINKKKWNEILYNHWFVWVEKTNIVCHLVHLLTDISLQTNKKNGTNILCVCVCRIMYHVTTWWCMANCFFLLFVLVCVFFKSQCPATENKTKQ